MYWTCLFCRFVWVWRVYLLGDLRALFQIHYCPELMGPLDSLYTVLLGSRPGTRFATGTKSGRSRNYKAGRVDPPGSLGIDETCVEKQREDGVHSGHDVDVDSSRVSEHVLERDGRLSSSNKSRLLRLAWRLESGAMRPPKTDRARPSRVCFPSMAGRMTRSLARTERGRQSLSHPATGAGSLRFQPFVRLGSTFLFGTVPCLRSPRFAVLDHLSGSLRFPM